MLDPLLWSPRGEGSPGPELFEALRAGPLFGLDLLIPVRPGGAEEDEIVYRRQVAETRRLLGHRFLTSGGCMLAGYGRSCAILRPSPTWERSTSGSAPAREGNLL